MSITKEEFYSRKEVVDYYDNRRFGGRSGQWVNKRELQLVNNLLPKKGKVLDLPCGTGRLANFLIERGYEVVCGDVSEAMLKTTKDLLESNAQIIKMNAAKIPFEDYSFNAVVQLRFYFHFKQIQNFLKEARRVLKNDGVLIFDTFNWSPRALPFLNKRVYIHSRANIHAILDSLDLKILDQKNCFLFSPLIYRFLPFVLVKALIKLEAPLLEKLLVRTFWKVGNK